MRTLIIDDERLARRSLSNLLESFPEIEIVGEATNAEEALKLVQELEPELLFLDIQMPDKNGFEFLAELPNVPQVIFVTAYDEYALEAFKANALDYLLKPVEEERLEEAIKKLKPVKGEATETDKGNNKLSLNEKIFIRDGEKCWFIALREIRLFESEGNYVRVYFQTYKPLILRSLNNLEERLDEGAFFRVSRKFIVNLHYIEHVEQWFNGGLMLTLTDKSKVEVSRRQASRFKELKSL